jgi:hypothetical protein
MTTDHMSKKWDAPIYVFFKPYARIKYIEDQKAHVFECIAMHCCCKSRYIQWFLYTGNTSSTSNLCWHAKICWGGDVIAAADTMGNIETAHKALSKKTGLNGSITAAFEQVGNSKVTYIHCAHTKLDVW